MDDSAKSHAISIGGKQRDVDPGENPVKSHSHFLAICQHPQHLALEANTNTRTYNHVKYQDISSFACLLVRERLNCSYGEAAGVAMPLGRRAAARAVAVTAWLGLAVLTCVIGVASGEAKTPPPKPLITVCTHCRIVVDHGCVGDSVMLRVQLPRCFEMVLCRPLQGSVVRQYHSRM